ncbi:MAG: hypothetical protein JO148_04560 [Acidimicrobiia bacterium]|nr:hypothetical protein [Acidimicrobiia bacterium]
MKASTLSIESQTDAHFLARMEEATAEERDAVFADLAALALSGDALAARTIRVLVLPACREMAPDKTDEQFVAALIDAAYEEVIDWAVSEGHAKR